MLTAHHLNRLALSSLVCLGLACGGPTSDISDPASGADETTGTVASAVSRPKPVIVFVNGYQDCCAWSMSSGGSADRLGDLAASLGMTVRRTAWDSFNDGSTTKAFIRVNKTKDFVDQGIAYLDSLPAGTDVYLIGHSFGADSLLSLVTSYRRSRVNIRLLAVIDPVGTGGLRSSLDQYKVGRNVEYFHNVWQQNEPFPFDYTSDGAIKCDALNCDQRENNFHRNADGSNVRENCTWIEVGCNGRVENPLNAKPGWKMKRAGHQGITTDAFVLNHLQTIIRNLASHEHPAAGQVPEMAPPPPPPPLSGPASYPIHVDVAKADATTVYDSVARVFSGGVQPLRYELLQQPESFGYFSFDPESGIFIFRPTSTYGVASFRFAVVDAKGQRLDSQVNISFDRSTIFPGHPPLTQTPTRPLPAAINPTMTLTSEASNESRRLDYASTEPAELLTVTDGALRLEAEAFLENLEDGYAGVLNCTVDWVGKDGIPVALKDNDEFPKNYFVTQSIPAVSLPPHEVTNFRMTCMAPDMPITIRDFPVVYAPSAPALRRPLEKDSYTYVDRSGAELKLTVDPDAGSSGARVYNYALESTECGKRSGTLRTEANQNRLNVDGAFNGFFAEGDEKKMVWSNVPVCGKASPILWKLRASGEKRDQGGICRYKHKKDTAGGKSGQMTGLDAFGNSRPCDRSGEWKKQCKDGTPDTEEVACDGPGGGAVAAPGLCQYKHKKDTAGGKQGQKTHLDAFGNTKQCDKNGDWKVTCKDGNGDTAEIDCR